MNESEKILVNKMKPLSLKQVMIQCINVIINFLTPINVHIFPLTLGHTGYYRWFIEGYAYIKEPMERSLKNT
jgi:hypothetical protein